MRPLLLGVEPTRSLHLPRASGATANLGAILSSSAVNWTPPSVGSVLLTQILTLAVLQTNRGSKSFNMVNSLRQLGCWMSMWTVSLSFAIRSLKPGHDMLIPRSRAPYLQIPDQSCFTFAWKSYVYIDYLVTSFSRDRLVDAEPHSRGEPSHRRLVAALTFLLPIPHLTCRSEKNSLRRLHCYCLVRRYSTTDSPGDRKSDSTAG